MTRDAGPHLHCGALPAAADLARYAAAAAAADDHERVLGPATEAFEALHAAICAGDRPAAGAAARAVQDLCLQACAAPAASARDADDRRRFLPILIGWAWPRFPATAAILEASRRTEGELWGWDADGTG